MSNLDQKELVMKYCETKDPQLREEIILSYQPLIHYISKKFAFNREDAEDIVQVGTIGMLRSLDRFDPNKDVEFSTFATPNIIGEIKHYFRDKNRILKTPRKLQELSSKINQYVRGCQNQGYSPTISEISRELDESEERILEAMEASQSTTVLSLDSPSYKGDSGGDSSAPTLLDNLGVAGSEETVLNRDMLDYAISQLDEREQKIIHLRFFCGQSQMDIAKQLGLSQMHISRILVKSIDRLQKILSDSDKHK